MSKKIKTNEEIYDEELKSASNISSYRQIALNAMYELKKQLKSNKCKNCQYNGKDERTVYAEPGTGNDEKVSVSSSD